MPLYSLNVFKGKPLYHMFKNSLSIRHYSPTLKEHSHQYHQLVFPLKGSLDIQTDRHQGLVHIGQCLIIKTGEVHGFKAHENARFIVADMQTLTKSLLKSEAPIFTVSKPLFAFLDYVDKQLSHQVDDQIEATCLSLFEQLLNKQVCLQNYDRRIEKVIQFINDDITQTHSLLELSQLACLSLTQFKKVFKDNTRLTVQAYVTQLRMQQAKSLLVHSDIPIRFIGEKVGYQNPSAFSRKFKDYFGQSPKDLIHLD